MVPRFSMPAVELPEKVKPAPERKLALALAISAPASRVEPTKLLAEI